MDNFEGIGESCTNAIRAWIGDDGTGASQDIFRDQRYSISEARRVATDAPDFVAAAALLQAWFTDRLTVEPGVTGPFAPIAFALLGNALELVNWYQIAEEVHGEFDA
jgi:hypothetical protein